MESQRHRQKSNVVEDGDPNTTITDEPKRRAKKRRRIVNHSQDTDDDTDDDDDEIAPPQAQRQRRQNQDDEETARTMCTFLNSRDSHSSMENLAAAADATSAYAASLRQQPPILFNPNHNRGDIESLRRLMALSFANSLAQSSFPIPSLYASSSSNSLNSLSALSILTDPHQQLSYQLGTASSSFAGLPSSLLQLDPFGSSLTMANLQTMQLANSLYGHSLGLPSTSATSAAAAALVAQQSRISQSGIPYNFPFAASSTSTAAHEYDGPASHHADRVTKSPPLSSSSTSPTTFNAARKRDTSMAAFPLDSGILLYMEDDIGTLNDHQIFLRKHIEFFRATQDDILSHTRGKNKPIYLRQVGLRCRHCSHVSVGRRQKGSTYFPSNLMGIYQAAQNLSVEHLQSGLCSETPADIKQQFVSFASTKPAASGAGKKYWAESGRMLGLVDTEEGIRFAADVGRIT